MIIGICKESRPGEQRVALVPAHVSVLSGFGEVIVQTGAGISSGFADDEYVARGARMVADVDAVLGESDVVCGINIHSLLAPHHKKLRRGQVVIGMMDPYQPSPLFQAFIAAGVTSFSLERIPRITKAQSMDVLSSMANLTGYKAVVLAANALPKMFPMMMTAAGTIAPARVLVLGVGVAGLQAIATAKRLGAVVSAYDIRPAVKEQVQSLGAKFLEVVLDTEQAESQGGYAKEMDEAFYAKQRQVMKTALAESDVVITTALIPGKPAPRLVTEEMLDEMNAGSVVVDLAAEKGGNVAGSRPGEEVIYKGIKILAPENAASELARNASQLLSKNFASYLDYMLKPAGSWNDGLSLDMTDEIAASTVLTHQGGIPDETLRQLLATEEKK